MQDIQELPRELASMTPEQLTEEAQKSAKRIARKASALAREIAHHRDVLARLGIGFEMVSETGE